jgi:hypothetical protein
VQHLLTLSGDSEGEGYGPPLLAYFEWLHEDIKDTYVLLVGRPSVKRSLLSMASDVLLVRLLEDQFRYTTSTTPVSDESE